MIIESTWPNKVTFQDNHRLLIMQNIEKVERSLKKMWSLSSFYETVFIKTRMNAGTLLKNVQLPLWNFFSIFSKSVMKSEIFCTSMGLAGDSSILAGDWTLNFKASQSDCFQNRVGGGIPGSMIDRTFYQLPQTSWSGAWKRYSPRECWCGRDWSRIGGGGHHCLMRWRRWYPTSPGGKIWRRWSHAGCHSLYQSPRIGGAQRAQRWNHTVDG